MATKRHLAAIMFTDITGFSAMMQTNEEYAKMIRKRHREIFRSSHDRYGGKILQYYGDGTLSIFESATAAVECAVEMQIEFRKEPEVPLRIGIHTGDISYDEEGAYGDGLNVAARVERMCETGAVFITGKVFDDIKNHRWLTAVSLGRFHLKNIFQNLEIFAVTSKGLTVPTESEVMAYPEYQAMKVGQTAPVMVGHKKKGVAFLLALLVGFFGIHRFYLGQRGKGIAHLIFAVFCIIGTAASEGEVPLAAAPAFLAMIDAILFLVMPRVDFNAKYNKAVAVQPAIQKPRRRVVAARREGRPQRIPEPVPRSKEADDAKIERSLATKSNALLRQGIRLYKKQNYDEAIDKFEEALEMDERNIAAYFNLACCYSMMKDAEKAFFFLAKAVEKGFGDFEKIHEHKGLAYIRSLVAYTTFVRNGYQILEQLPAPKENLLDNLGSFDPSILDKIENLGELLERGELTREEFEKEKLKILKREE